MALPKFNGKISIFYSAIVTFHSPSDVSGITGMHQKHIWTAPSWRNKTTHYDCIFVSSKPELDGIHDLEVACVMAFFLFVHEGKEYLCALIHWFSYISNTPNEDHTNILFYLSTACPTFYLSVNNKTVMNSTGSLVLSFSSMCSTCALLIDFIVSHSLFHFD